MNHLLSVENLHVRFRTMGLLQSLANRSTPPFIDAVCGVSFNIDKGETLGLIGESGSGKSTVARALMGLLQPASGTINFCGERINTQGRAERKQYRRRVTMMFQDPVGSLSPRLTVRSLLMEPFRIHGVTNPDPAREVDRLLSLVGLPKEFGRRYPHQLSGGQARRVGVARALALNPDLVIADEPTAGLDVSIQGEVLNLLSSLQEELGIAILIITHNLNVVRHITDRIAIMYLGRFLETGPTDAIFARPRHPYTEALLAASPPPDPDAKVNRIEISGEVPSLMKRPSGCEFHTRCPHVHALCNQTFPGLSLVEGGNNHTFRCHYPLGGAD